MTDRGVLAIVCSALLTGFIAWIAFIVNRSEAERKKRETALGAGREQLDQLMERVEESEGEGGLRRRVTLGFGVAVLLTGLLGFLSWHNVQQAAEDADWVSHTHEVMTGLEATLRHLLDVETGGRGFALSGDRQFLEPYDGGRTAIGQDLQALRLLVRDNPDQKRRLETLEEQAETQIADVEKVVKARQITERAPTVALPEHGKHIMDAARLTVAEMEAMERALLEQRTQRARTAQHFTSLVIVVGSFFGVVFLSIAGARVSREIGISAKARAQISTLNADLERRVAERTEALGQSEGRLAGVIQSAMDAIITADDQQQIVMFNCAAEKMFRCQAAEALGVSPSSVSFRSASVRLMPDTSANFPIRASRIEPWAPKMCCGQ
jgi:CHASE3 domain sensor protein